MGVAKNGWNQFSWYFMEHQKGWWLGVAQKNMDFALISSKSWKLVNIKNPQVCGDFTISAAKSLPFSVFQDCALTCCFGSGFGCARLPMDSVQPGEAGAKFTPWLEEILGSLRRSKRASHGTGWPFYLFIDDFDLMIHLASPFWMISQPCLLRNGQLFMDSLWFSLSLASPGSVSHHGVGGEGLLWGPWDHRAFHHSSWDLGI